MENWINETRKVLLQLELDEADNTERYKRMAKIIEAEPNMEIRTEMLDKVAETLGAEAIEEVSRMLRHIPDVMEWK
jgi:uncharacterized protein YfbU (UPF0304 family)